ncbi:MAG: glycosyltransferase family 2 protein [Candidatus Omnitrophica bacterium]|nr:glycosyltransferase family 2 protein [Candidatus Omnitrophota bacterium]
MSSLSVILPVYNEEKNLPIIFQKLKEVLEQLEIDWEVIFVNDGSNDASGKELEKILQDDNKVKVVNLARNYGQTQALAAGIDNAKGEIIVTIDADLQNDPQDIPRLIKKLDEGYDLVSGWRFDRQDDLLLKKIPSFIANRISRAITKIDLHDLGCSLKAYRREVFDSIEFHGEIHRFLPIWAMINGAKISEIKVKHYKRKFGKSKYGLSRVVNVVLDMFVLIFMWKFINKPIYVFGGAGIALLGGSGMVGGFIIIRKLFFNGVWVSPLLFIFVILSTMGIQFILMGILADLIIRLYYGAKAKKRYCIKTVLKKKD